MEKVKMKFGNTEMYVSVKEENLIGVIEANEVPGGKTEEQIIEESLKNPIGSARLRELYIFRFAPINLIRIEPTPQAAVYQPAERPIL